MRRAQFFRITSCYWQPTEESLALVALDVEESHPLALPEPPAPEKVAAYEQHMSALTRHICLQAIGPCYASPSTITARLPDRAGSYLSRTCGQVVARILSVPRRFLLPLASSWQAIWSICAKSQGTAACACY